MQPSGERVNRAHCASEPVQRPLPAKPRRRRMKDGIVTPAQRDRAPPPRVPIILKGKQQRPYIVIVKSLLLLQEQAFRHALG